MTPKIKEHTCPAYSGTGYPVVMQPVQPGRKIYPVKASPATVKGRSRTPPEATRSHPPACRTRAEGKKQMIKSKRSAEQQVADELERRALHPLSSRQTISDSQAEPEFHANHKRLRAERLARETVELGLKVKK
jgi:hypothetical protein